MLRLARLAALALLTTASLGCATEDTGCYVAPLSRRIVYEKIDFLGSWEHTAELESAGESGLTEGALTSPRGVAFSVEEDWLVGRADGDFALLFALAGHVTAGYTAGGGECFAYEPRPWHEHTHMSVDWSKEQLALPEWLPVDPDTELEPDHYLPDLASEDPLWFHMVRDDDGRLIEFHTPVSYWLTPCPDCPPTPLLITHHFTRPTL